MSKYIKQEIQSKTDTQGKIDPKRETTNPQLEEESLMHPSHKLITQANKKSVMVSKIKIRINVSSAFYITNIKSVHNILT